MRIVAGNGAIAPRSDLVRKDHVASGDLPLSEGTLAQQHRLDPLALPRLAGAALPSDRRHATGGLP